jgi:hypothetical protein
MVAARTAGHVELRSQAAALLRDARASGLTRARITDLRRLGERLGWAEEELMVRLTGGGTRSWSAAEMSELLTSGRVAGYTPHHINSVAGSPWLAGTARNIRIVTPGEHALAHTPFGATIPDTTVPTYGPLINRSRLIIDALR